MQSFAKIILGIALGTGLSISFAQVSYALDLGLLTGEKVETINEEEIAPVATFVREIDGKEMLVDSISADAKGVVSLNVEPALRIDEYFEGWKNETGAYVGTRTTTITEDTTFYAKIGKKVWVNFETGDGAENVGALVVMPGTTIKSIPEPKRTGYEFIEWKKDGEAFDFKEKIVEDIVLTAEWKVAEAPYTIVVRREDENGQMKAVQTILDRKAMSGSLVTISSDDTQIKFSTMKDFVSKESEITKEISSDGTTVFYVDFLRKKSSDEDLREEASALPKDISEKSQNPLVINNETPSEMVQEENHSENEGIAFETETKKVPELHLDNFLRTPAEIVVYDSLNLGFSPLSEIEKLVVPPESIRFRVIIGYYVKKNQFEQNREFRAGEVLGRRNAKDLLSYAGGGGSRGQSRRT
ncbi:InlB B-repeat-containing protein [Candidatus Saccharibacteria bacterium]|nr:InlB B-repeat-containing protein [Candidatus Saccharibacteria bacterium]